MTETGTLRPEVFEDAAALIEEQGLCKGWFAKEEDLLEFSEGKGDRWEGSLCVVGAIDLVLNGSPVEEYNNDPYVKYLSRMVIATGWGRSGEESVVGTGKAYSNDWEVVPWNDAPERTVEEVVALLRDAAEALTAR